MSYSLEFPLDEHEVYFVFSTGKRGIQEIPQQNFAIARESTTRYLFIHKFISQSGTGSRLEEAGAIPSDRTTINCIGGLLTESLTTVKNAIFFLTRSNKYFNSNYAANATEIIMLSL